MPRSGVTCQLHFEGESMFIRSLRPRTATSCARLSLVRSRLLAIVVAVVATTLGGASSVAFGSAELADFGVDSSPPPAGPAPDPEGSASSAPPTQTQDAGDEPSVTAPMEYSSLIRSQSATGALDSGLLGESIDYYTGQTDFTATDISLRPTSGLPLKIRRVYHVENKAGGIPQGLFGDWGLDVPRIETVLAT